MCRPLERPYRVADVLRRDRPDGSGRQHGGRENPGDRTEPAHRPLIIFRLKPEAPQNYSAFVLNEKVWVTTEMILTGSPLISTGS